MARSITNEKGFKAEGRGETQGFDRKIGGRKMGREKWGQKDLTTKDTKNTKGSAFSRKRLTCLTHYQLHRRLTTDERRAAEPQPKLNFNRR